MADWRHVVLVPMHVCNNFCVGHNLLTTKPRAVKFQVHNIRNDRIDEKLNQVAFI